MEVIPHETRNLNELVVTSEMEMLPVVDLTDYLHEVGNTSLPHSSLSSSRFAECRQLADALEHFGAVLVRDPRVSRDDNDRFLDLMEMYYAQPREVKLADARPDVYYQVGVTPDGTERPRTDRVNREMADTWAKKTPRHAPHPVQGADPKWRFFWRIGPRLPEGATAFPEMNAEPVIPLGLADQWAPVMDAWGNKLLGTAQVVAAMLGHGLRLSDPGALTSLMKYGSHLLAPTGADLDQWHGGAKPGTVLAGFHYDLNLMSLHGKARYPGLFIWTREGIRMPVRVPEGTLLVQAGIQLEWLTAGRIQRGYHEVVVSEATREVYEREKITRGEGAQCWRVSSTMFFHVAADQDLYPLPGIQWDESNEEKRVQYPRIKAGQQVFEELQAISLATRS